MVVPMSSSHSRDKAALALVVALCTFTGLALSSGACATSANAYLGDEGGLFGSEAGAGGEGGPGGGEGGAGDGEAGAVQERIACGPGFCRSDEKCVASACTYDCTGTKVPGDYATISSAITALAAAGSDVTICLGAIQAGETVSISDPAAHMKKLSITAIAPLQTTLGSVSVGTGFSEVTLVGFGTSSTVTVSGAPKVTMRGLKMSSPSSYAVQLSNASTATGSSVVIDGCDISTTTATSTTGYGVYVASSYATPFAVAIQNSYIHNAAYGIYTYAYAGTLELTVANNTIDKASNGIYVYGSTGTGSAAVKYFNNIISNSTMTAVTVSGTTTALTHSNNALFGNTTNYGGTAVEGTAYVKTACDFDTSSGVPEPKAGSPCKGAGKSDGAPPLDYWNALRPTAIDLGAVQGF